MAITKAPGYEGFDPLKDGDWEVVYTRRVCGEKYQYAYITLRRKRETICEESVGLNHEPDTSRER